MKLSGTNTRMLRMYFNRMREVPKNRFNKESCIELLSSVQSEMYGYLIALASNEIIDVNEFLRLSDLSFQTWLKSEKECEQ